MSAKRGAAKMAVLSALAVLLAASARTALAANRPAPPRSPSEVIACRVLEAFAADHEAVTLVVFHHSQPSDSARLATLLRQHSGARIEFETVGGAWHPATVLRLKSCFGRGLLVFAGREIGFTKGSTFVLRLPAQ